MDGQGVTNYAAKQPSYGISAETTQFDNALIRHGVVTHQDALVAKGASRQQAQDLVEQNTAAGLQQQQEHRHWNQTDGKEEPESDEDYLDDDDDDFMAQYRQKRMQEMQQQQQAGPFGEAYEISRPEWQTHVNDASQAHWVVVCLTSNDVQRTGKVEHAIRRELAAALPHVKFVLIAASAAIANWPVAQLPTLLAYRHGQMQHQFTSLPVDTSADDLQTLLVAHGIFQKEEGGD